VKQQKQKKTRESPQTEKIHILIADDHKMFREGLKEILGKEPNLAIVGEAGDGREVIGQMGQHPVDVVLMDIDMPGVNGIETTRHIVQKHPHTRVLVLSMHSDAKYIISMLEAGAKGYVLKTAGKEEMIAAVNAVASGDSYFSHLISTRIIEQLQHHKVGSGIASAAEQPPLTPREFEVLKLIALEYSNPEIAQKLYISIRTVDTHRRNLLEKLGVKNTAGLVKYALKMGLLDESTPL